MYLAGIDEAGLGPILGPYCAGLALFESEDNRETDLYTLLEGVAGGEKGDIPVCDSKKIYTPQKGIARLERTVLLFYSLLHGEPGDFKTLLSRLSRPTQGETLPPWAQERETLALPLCEENKSCFEISERLGQGMDERGVKLKSLRVQNIGAQDFNTGLAKLKNKATLCQAILTPLMEEALAKEELILTVDRQGGRRFYGEWLINLMPGSALRAESELAKESTYNMGSKRVRFLVGGDNFALETALASLFAKYTRECSMILFNRYWREQCPHIKKTAGYYKDGKRFISDLKKEGKLPANLEILERTK